MKYLYTLSLLLIGSLLTGQNPIVIGGHIADAQGNPFANYPVFITSQQDSGYALVTLTDDLGNYSEVYDEGQSQGCFTVTTVDCYGMAESMGGCWSPVDTVFDISFTFDCDSLEDCSVYIIAEETGAGILLTAETPNATVPVSYLWDTGDTTSSILVAVDGIYCVTVTDADGCVSEACFVVDGSVECDAYFFHDLFTNVLEAYAAGEGAIQYTWEFEGQIIGTDDVVDVIGEGEYCLSIEDEVGCTSTYCEYIVQDSFPTDCFVFIYETAAGLLVAEPFGVGPFTYLWSNGSTDMSIQYSNNDSTIYCVEVTDATGCVAEACYEPFVWDSCSVYVQCDPSPAGVVLVAIPFGQGPFTYAWSTGDSTDLIEITESGDYCVTVTDVTGCVSEWCQYVDVDGNNICQFDLFITDYDDSLGVYTVDVITYNNEDFIFYLNNSMVDFPITLEQGTYCFEGVDDSTNCVAFNCIELGSQSFCPGYAVITSDSVGSGFLLTVEVFDGSGDYEIQWSNGEVGPSITVGALDELYCAEIIDVADSCFYQACLEPDFPWADSAFMVGVAYDAVTGKPLEGSVTLYQLNSDSTLTELQQVDIQGGAYFFGLGCTGDYIVKADAVDPEGVDEYIPTFHESAEFWEQATKLSCSATIPVIIADIAAIKLNGVQGPGGTNGRVYDGDNFTSGDSGSNRDDEPVEGADILVMTLDNQPVKHVRTDADGYYVVNNLPYGRYYVYLAIPGIKTQRKEIVISPDQGVITGVDFDTDGILSTSVDVEIAKVNVHPNPTTDRIMVEGIDLNTCEIYMFDNVGNKARVKTDGTYIDVSQLLSGVYRIQFIQSDKIHIASFIKL